MGRWEPDSRQRLQEAALELYSERGFDQTTAAQIAVRAGLTERTFFRHFADKREVLFSGSAVLKDRIIEGVAHAPPDDGPLDAVAAGLNAGAAMLGQLRRDSSRRRQAVIAANPELHERELAKLSDWAASIAATLRSRGVGEHQAMLAAEAGMTVLRLGIQQWANEAETRDLSTVIVAAFEDLRALSVRPASAKRTARPREQRDASGRNLSASVVGGRWREA